MRVLIVEDEVFLAEAVQTALRQAMIAADIANDGESALERIAINNYDVMILDRDLPEVHGDDICRQVVANRPEIRVLMLTAAGRLNDKVSGFEIGADDYLSKPFDMPELVARLIALGRRSSQARDPVLEYGQLRIDPFRHEAYRNGRLLHLTRKEFAVLTLLVQAGGGVLSAEFLLEKAWDENADPFTNAIRVTISVLRKKLGNGEVIGTVPGVGYRILDNARDQV
ncbi:response regulator transcription factor [Brevibacterium sp. FAM 25378]|uniref:response regulator transcription factor n=1 Tax=unclassified Brevibacterium TaxID=2614124 RepID=UPI001092AB3C|nr:response regulator transcription factor [Brevibacterium sp. S22]TGD27618.1 DNA-binding response regulator [Brevibacterium sp. S22]